MRNQPKIILGFLAEHALRKRINAAAAQSGFQLDCVELADQAIAQSRSGLIDAVSSLSPVLVLFDLDHPALPWREWLIALKTSPATFRIPVICFASHVPSDLIRDAGALGVELVLPRQRLLERLPTLLQEYARLPDYTALENACQQPLSEVARHGLQLFNAGEYFEAHEVLEEAWMADQSPGRELYRAVLQVAVAYLQIERRNYPGAVKMFLRLRQWLAPLPDACQGIDIASLRQDVQTAYERLKQLDPSRIDEFDQALLKPIRYRML